MKAQVRTLGIDDGPFAFGDRDVPVVGVLMRTSYVDAVLTTRVAVDGTDATDALVTAVQRSRYREQVRAILLDGAALGGFNVVDLEALERRTGIPAITVTRDPPDFAAIRRALKRRFADHERRFAILTQGPLVRVATAYRPIHCRFVGIGHREGTDLLRAATVRGAVPEPIRMAHLMARAMVRGESRGDA